ncbi:MAG: twin-arginine translocation pathway signal [Xanthobacteraceae bacterium]|nr:twin-arginine translocation pathway signal [Xanthobacteraceae bacterium]
MSFDSPAARSPGRSVLLRATALLLACAVGGGAMSGCTQMPDAMSAAFADPAKYDLYNCVQLRTARKENSKRIAELRGLIARADTATGGPVVAEVAYGNDLLTARASAALADEAWRRNHCDNEVLPPEKVDTPAAAPAATAKPGRHGQ